MPQEFKAIINEAHDESVWIENPYSAIGPEATRKPSVRRGLKSASFVLRNIGECPWPPISICGKTVRVIVED